MVRRVREARAKQAAEEHTKKIAEEHERLSKMSVKELKELLEAAGANAAGATEKDDLVRLLARTNAQAAAHNNQLVATEEWQEVAKGVAIPQGCEVKFDMATGKNYARLSQAKKD